MPAYPLNVIAPAGLAPPLYDPTTAERSATPALLADLYDVDTGELYLLEEVHPVVAAVQSQFRLEYQSGAAVGQQGQRFRDVDKVTDGTPARLEAEVRRLMQPFVDRGDVAILNVTAEAPPPGASSDTGGVVVEFLNLLTNRPARLFLTGERK